MAEMQALEEEEKRKEALEGIRWAVSLSISVLQCMQGMFAIHQNLWCLTQTNV